MRVGNLGLGTYPSQNARLLYYFLHLNIKIGPTVANQYSSWTNRELQGIAIEKWHSKCRKIKKCSKWAVCIMKSTFYCTKMERNKSIKMLKPIFNQYYAIKNQKMVINISVTLVTHSCWQVDEKNWIFHICHIFFRLLGLSCFLRSDF